MIMDDRAGDGSGDGYNIVTSFVLIIPTHTTPEIFGGKNLMEECTPPRPTGRLSFVAMSPNVQATECSTSIGSVWSWMVINPP